MISTTPALVGFFREMAGNVAQVVTLVFDRCLADQTQRPVGRMPRSHMILEFRGRIQSHVTGLTNIHTLTVIFFHL